MVSKFPYFKLFSICNDVHFPTLVLKKTRMPKSNHDSTTDFTGRKYKTNVL